MTNLKYILALTLIFLTYNISISQTWVQQSSGTALNLNSVYFIDANTGFIGADSGRVLKTSNSGVNWTSTTTDFNFNIINVKFFNTFTGIASGNKIIKTTNGGLNWFSLCDTAFGTDIFCLDSLNWFVSSILPHTNKKTTNGGISWSNIGIPEYIHMSICFVDQNTGWIAGQFPSGGGFGSQHIYRSLNSGINWTSQYLNVLQNGNGWVYDIFFLNVSTGFGVLYGADGPKIVKTTNSGTNWLATAVTASQKNIYFFDGNTGWTCGVSGLIMKTLNTGDSWASEQTPVTTTLNSIYFPANETGWTCGANGVILKTTNGGITAIEQTGNNIPSNFSLSQNYPNPFNPATQISFDIPKSSFVSLMVYDELGREIEKLVNQDLNPGSYKYDWDAAQYPSGVYFYKIQAGEFTETKKMVLVK